MFTSIFFRLKRQYSKWLVFSFSLLFAISCDSFEDLLDVEEVNTVIDDGGVFSEADMFFGVFPGSEYPFYYLTQENEVLLCRDSNFDGQIDAFYIESGQENIYVDIREDINLPGILSTSAGELLFFDYSADLSKTTITHINANGISETFEDIPVDELVDNNTSSKIGELQTTAEDDSLNRQIESTRNQIEFWRKIISCGGAIASGFIPVAFIVCGVEAPLTGFKALESAKIGDENQTRISPNTLNAINNTLDASEQVIFSANLVRCGMQTVSGNRFACAKEVIAVSNPGKAEEIQQLEDDLIGRFVKFIDEKVNSGYPYPGTLTFLFQPGGTAGNDCTCGRGTARATVDFGNGLQERIAIGTTRRNIRLEAGVYDVTVTLDSGRDILTSNLIVSDFNWNYTFTCQCIELGSKDGVSKCSIIEENK